MNTKPIIAGICLLFTLLAACSSPHTKNSKGDSGDINDTATIEQINAALNKFPGFTEKQMRRLMRARQRYCIPADMDGPQQQALKLATNGKCTIALPTWIPEGFEVDDIAIRLGKGLDADSLALSVTYRKMQPENSLRFFTIAARFDTSETEGADFRTVKSSIGDIDLFYQPVEQGKKNRQIVHTNAFSCGSNTFPRYMYINVSAYDGDDDHGEIIPIEETKKIIGSMECL